MNRSSSVTVPPRSPSSSRLPARPQRQPVLLHGDLEFLPLEHNVLNFVRSNAEQALFMSFNLDAAERFIPLQALGLDGSRLSALGNPATRQGRIEGEFLVLPGHSVLIADVR